MCPMIVKMNRFGPIVWMTLEMKMLLAWHLNCCQPIQTTQEYLNPLFEPQSQQMLGLLHEQLWLFGQILHTDEIDRSLLTTGEIPAIGIS